MEEILSMIPIQYIVLIGGLIVMGEILKRFTVLPNKMLTIVLPLFGSAACIFAYICDSNVFLVGELIAALNKGLCCGFAATGGYELFMNTFIKKENGQKVINICEKIKEVTEELSSVGEPEETVVIEALPEEAQTIVEGSAVEEVSEVVPEEVTVIEVDTKKTKKKRTTKKEKAE